MWFDIIKEERENILKNEQNLDKIQKLVKEVSDKIIENFEKSIWMTNIKMKESHAQDLHDVVHKLNEIAGLIDTLTFSRKWA